MTAHAGNLQQRLLYNLECTGELLEVRALHELPAPRGLIGLSHWAREVPPLFILLGVEGARVDALYSLRSLVSYTY